MRTKELSATGNMIKTQPITVTNEGDRPTGSLPIYFPAQTVKLLEELLEASGTLLSVHDYADEFLSQEILACLNREEGVIEILAGSYELEPGDIPAMRSVVARWISQKKGAA